MQTGSLLFGAAALIVSLLLLRKFAHHDSSLGPLPPGPKPLPFLGNLLHLPTGHEWLTFKKWGQQYGHVVSVSVFGRTIIILNSMRAISDVLEKKSATSAGRPHLVMACDLVGMGRAPNFTNDLELHRKHRRLMAQALNARASREYWPLQVSESRKMMVRVLDMPGQLDSHIRRTVIGVIFLVTYGYEIQSNDDHFVWLGSKVMEDVKKFMSPRAYLVDALPILRFIPSWVPGAGFQREARVFRAHWFELLQRPFDMVKAHMAAGTARPSYTANLLDRDGSVVQDLEEQDLIMRNAGVLYAAGSDTTVAAIKTFYFAMLLYPEVQMKAQAELDEVVGKERMPMMEDWDRLVYCSAIVKETLRWHPVVPLAVPHAMTRDEQYDGYLFPKGSTIIGNVWTVLRDPTVYPSPDVFLPERFISLDGKSLRNPEGALDFSAACFGFGRRVCPGNHLAEATLYLAVVSTLWTFDISKPMGPDGNPIEPDREYEPGIVHHPKDFACDIKPRSVQAAEIVRQTVG